MTVEGGPLADQGAGAAHRASGSEPRQRWLKATAAVAIVAIVCIASQLPYWGLSEMFGGSLRAALGNFQVASRGMEPTLHPNDRLIVNRLAYVGPRRPERGDVVVFETWSDKKHFIKRVVGVPGDTIAIHDGSVHIDGQPLDEPCLDQPTADQLPPLTLGPDQYYVLGDNRGNSSDSRTYGVLPANLIDGKAWFVYWPSDHAGVIR